MPERNLVGHIYVNDDDVLGCSQKYGVSAIVRNRGGQGLTLPLHNITPNDLRVLADYLEEKEKKVAESAT